MMIQCVFINKNKSRLTDIKNKLMFTKEETWARGKDKLGAWDQHTHYGINIHTTYINVHICM